MARFWIWAVRNPALLLAALATAFGATGVADWSLAMAAVLVTCLFALAANHLARRAAARRERQRAALAALRRHDALLEKDRRRAA